MRLGVVYKVSCSGNENFLYGSTLNFQFRKNSYYSDLALNRWKNQYLQNCYNFYGENSITIDIIQEGIPEDILEAVEDIWIGANCSRIEDSMGGMNMRDAQRPNHTQETKDKIGRGNKGKKRTLEQRAALSKGLTGRTVSEETKNKIAISNGRLVYQYDLNGKFIKEWWGAMAAARFINGQDSLIIRCCKGRTAQHCGFMWFYDYQGETTNPYKKKPNIYRKSVLQLDSNDNVIKKWDSLSDINKVMGYSLGNISSVLNGKRNYANGFKWKYA